jgi:hypothetical protein
MDGALTSRLRLRRRTGDALGWVPTRGVVETFILIQFLWGALLFLPGAQSFRFYVRALPYVSSLALFAFYYGGRRRLALPAAGKLVVLALLLLVVNLAHPETQFRAGLAQCLFQFSIAAPVFWAGKVVREARFLNRLLWLTFVANAVNAVVGLLQIYFPAYLMPPEFSAVAHSMNQRMVESLTYEGSGGQQIIRPPGLSDMPGGAAVGAMVTAVMGLALSLRREWGWRTRLFCLALSGVAMVTLYLTQVRAFFVMMMVSFVALVIVAVRRGQRWEGVWVASVSLGLLAAAFVWAISIGGRAVSDRFLGISETGLINSIQMSRGIFVEHTLTHTLFEYPLGGGLGRWGMMGYYFGEAKSWDTQPIWVEIQMTGWLVDGGVLMWLFYGGAVGAAVLYACRQALTAADRELKHAARIVFCFTLIVAGVSFAGPAFNTQLGIQFWFMFAALHGAAARPRLRAPRDGTH